MNKTKELVVLMHETIGFSKLIRTLAKEAGEEGIVKDFMMMDCVVTGVPQGTNVFHFIKRKYLFGLIEIKHATLFMGFECQGGTIARCTFIGRKKKK